ncbi:MAG: SDR family oxidoreductase [Pseudomonadota bacterium]
MAISTQRTLLSIGHGYSARELAKRLLTGGWRVIGTTRSEDKAKSIRATGAEAVIWPGADLSPLLAEASHLLLSAGPQEDGDPVLAALGGTLPANSITWAGYLSTTGVYGDRSGGWVDETSECTPATRRGQWRLAAEREWAATGLPLHIFRLAGIYGPGRGPFAKVRSGTARRIIKPGQIFSRTHVDDIASILEASISSPRPGAVYNVCDNEAAPPEDVIAHAAELLGLPVPDAVAFEDADMSPMARSFYAESKRVSNRRTLDELGVSLRYPTYREGLAALLSAETQAV